MRMPNFRSQSYRPVVERAEPRQLLSTFTVSSVADSGPGTLRQAILNANAAPAPNLINFAIGPVPGGVKTIALAAPLPTISAPVTIDGTTQPGYANTPVIELNGLNAGASADGLVLAGGNSIVQGLTVDGFSGNQVLLTSKGGDLIAGNILGLTPNGLAARGGAGSGVLVETATNTIGGTTPTAKNVISGNGDGVTLLGDANRVQGNRIGTDVNGSRPVANGGNGVRVAGGANNTIGGLIAGSNNVISGNRGDGIRLESGPNVVQGNAIGTDAGGSVVLGNGGSGVEIVNAGFNLIGGVTATAPNVLSGNGLSGLTITGPNAIGNLVQGNAIGTNAAGSTALGNAASGILVSGGASANMIGGVASSARNIISANQLDGVALLDHLGTGNAIIGNAIGTDAAGTKNLGNGGSGVDVDASQTLIASNVIANNGRDGVLIRDGRGNTIRSNSIFNNNVVGVDVSLTANGRLGHPLIRSITRYQHKTVIRGIFRGNEAHVLNTLQFFVNNTASPSGFGEGQAPLGSLVVRTHGLGGVHWTFTVPTGALTAGQFLSVTATDPNGNTSGFSPAVVVPSALILPPAPRPVRTVGSALLATTQPFSGGLQSVVVAPVVATTPVVTPVLATPAVTGTRVVPFAGDLQGGVALGSIGGVL